MRQRTTLLTTFLLLLISVAAAAQENGEVIIGSRDSGETLDEDDFEGPLMVVIDTPYQVFDDTGTFIHVAAWHTDGRPAADADVYLSGHLVGQTDSHGSFVFRWGVPGTDVENYWLTGSTVTVVDRRRGDDYAGSVWFNAFSRTESFESDHVYVYADRGVYEPGDTVQVRMIGWHLAADYVPLEESDVEISIYSASGSLVVGDSVSTDDFGTAATSFELPDTLEEGMYRLTVAYEGATAETDLRIERFTPPVIEIDHTLPRFLMADQDELAWEVELSYFAGGEPESATYTFEATSGNTVLYSETVERTGSGPHEFAWGSDVLDQLRPSLYEGANFDLRVEVTDDVGRSDELTREIEYTSNPYIVVIESDRYEYSTGDEVEVVVRMTDRDRVPVRATDVRLQLDDGTEMTSTSDDGGAAVFSWEFGGSGTNVSVYMPDIDAPVATRWLGWIEPQPMRSHIDNPVVLENEDTDVVVRFPAGFEPAEDVVHMDVVDTSGSLVNAVLLPISRRDGEYVAEGSFSAPSWGSMLLTFFCLGEMSGDAEGHLADIDESTGSRLGLMTEGQNLVVHPGRQLQIELDGIADEIAPGSDYSGAVVVRDANGNPVDAAVGVSVVDEAVISLLDPMEITPMDHFYNPELRTMSTTGAAILSWPVVSRNWGGRQGDVALPPFPWLDGGEVNMPSVNRSGGVMDTLGGSMGGEMMYDMDMESADDFGGLGATGMGSGGGGYGYGMAGGSAPEPLMLEASENEMAYAPPMEEQSMGYRGEGQVVAPPEDVVIEIRTEFPDTSLWLPDLVANDGETTFSGTMPDAMTRQEILIVASDGNGGVGVHRESVTVTQPLYVQLEAPDVMVDGDVARVGLFVQNRAEGSVAGQTTLSVSGGAATPASVEAFETTTGSLAVVWYDVVATSPGPMTLTGSASGEGVSDGQELSIWVDPRGAPTTEIVSGAVRRDDPLTLVYTIDGSADWVDVTLSMAFPAVTDAFAGFDLARERLNGQDPLGASADLISALLLLEYQELHEVEAWVSREELAAWIPWLESFQYADGGWGVWWEETSSPYFTAYVVEALVEAERLGFDVDDEVVKRAVDFLLGDRDGAWYDQSTIAFWEGNTESVQRALTAEIFSVLSRVPDRMLSDDAQEELLGMGEALLEHVEDRAQPDPLMTAHTVMGLIELRDRGWLDGEEVPVDMAVSILENARTDSHWEPSWFNAYGGTIEATVAVLEVLSRIDEEGFDRARRDAVRYLLSTRDGWGSWHNERGTAWAIRGLLLAGAAPAEIASTVNVFVDDALVESITVDPSDPFLSTSRLRQLSLREFSGAGTHTVRVEYDGALSPDVRVTVDSYADETVVGDVRLNLSADEVSVGENMTLEINGLPGDGLFEARLRVPSGLAAPDELTQRLRETEGVMHAWTADGVVRFVVAAGFTEAIELEFAPQQAGEMTASLEIVDGGGAGRVGFADGRVVVR